MLASKIAQKYSIETLISEMEGKGYQVKDFSDKPRPEESYRNWYYRIRKTHEISGVWHIGSPNIFFYRKKENKKDE